MRWMHRHRTLVAVVTLLATVVAQVAPVAAWYDPKTGRFLQRDPNGTALLVTDVLSESARNPTVHVWLTACAMPRGEAPSKYPRSAPRPA